MEVHKNVDRSPLTVHRAPSSNPVFRRIPARSGLLGYLDPHSVLSTLLSIRNPKSEIRNGNVPHSAFRIPHLICLLLSLALSACSPAPYTGRQQLILVSDDQLNAIGLKSYQKILNESKLSHNEAIVSMVRRAGLAVAQAANRPDYNWEFNVIDNAEVANAFALPGGKVAVYTGILPYTQTENGMAAVISHEVAHVIANHGAERMSQNLLAQLGQIGLNIVLREQGPLAVEAAQLAYGVGTQVGFILPFSRKEELEADRIGLILMAQAGYDPTGAIDFWQRMSKSGKDKVPVFLSTHPTDEARIGNIKTYLPEALGHYQQKLD
ncbi:MAG: M48 family metallopeptidase [Pseudomonadota bacterium]